MILRDGQKKSPGTGWKCGDHNLIDRWYYEDLTVLMRQLGNIPLLRQREVSCPPPLLCSIGTQLLDNAFLFAFEKLAPPYRCLQTYGLLHNPSYRFRRDPYRSFATPGVYRQTDFYARDPGVDVSDWDVYRFNDLRGPTSIWHYTESEASGDESEDDDASHATGSTHEEALE